MIFKNTLNSAAKAICQTARSAESFLASRTTVLVENAPAAELIQSGIFFAVGFAALSPLYLKLS